MLRSAKLLTERTYPVSSFGNLQGAERHARTSFKLLARSIYSQEIAH